MDLTLDTLAGAGVNVLVILFVLAVFRGDIRLKREIERLDTALQEERAEHAAERERLRADYEARLKSAEAKGDFWRDGLLRALDTNAAAINATERAVQLGERATR